MIQRLVIVRLWGGLGNQLFQYAAGYAAACKRNAALILDRTQCDADENRPYELGLFSISGRCWDNRERKQFEMALRLVRPNEHNTRWRNRLIKPIVRKFASHYLKLAVDLHTGYDERAASGGRHLYLAGTWASEGYFRDFEVDIRREFQFLSAPSEVNAKYLMQINSSNSVCVHVRRGDYVSIPDTNKRFGLLPLEYYRTALEIMGRELSKPIFFIFSDDPAWTKENLILNHPTFYIEHNVGVSNVDDFRLMRECKHFVIANSTFSWWAAWLSENKQKTVIAPKQWRIDSNGIADPVPATWRRL